MIGVGVDTNADQATRKRRTLFSCALIVNLEGESTFVQLGLLQGEGTGAPWGGPGHRDKQKQGHARADPLVRWGFVKLPPTGRTMPLMLPIVLSLLTPALAAPSGYAEIRSDTGVKLWEQIVSGGEPDYVLEIDLDHARLESVVDPTGGALWRHTALDWWTNHGAADQFAVVNGAFFWPGGDPTEPAFGLRHPSFVHDGYGTHTEYVGEQFTLHQDGNRVNLYGADPAMIHDGAAAPVQTVALGPYADKSAGSWVARTFIGFKDHDGTGHRTVLVFASKLATQQYARDELARWGTTTVIMYDGGGSTQLVVQGQAYIDSTRGVPHVFRVLAGAPGGGDADADADADSDVDADADVDSDVDADADADTDADGDADADSDADGDADADSDANSDTGTAVTASGCGCQTPTAPALWVLWLLPVLGLRRGNRSTTGTEARSP